MLHKVYRTQQENGATTLQLVRTDSYNFEKISDRLLMFTRNGVNKLIRIIPDREFTFKLQKTQIRAAGGVDGLLAFLNNRNWESTAVKIADWALDTMRGA